MCGIIGYASKKNTVQLSSAVELLQFLEYRGYDSAGIGYIDDAHVIQTIKAVGPIKQLAKKVAEQNVQTHCAIAHTRWATHGGITEYNAHPHGQDSVSIVHNGIVENYQELREELKREGFVFETETDTEVASKLILSLLRKNMPHIEIMKTLHKRIEGAYAFVILFDDGRLMATRNRNPLIFSGSEDELWISSDIMPIGDKPVGFLQNFEILEYNGAMRLYDKNGVEITPQLSPISADLIKPTKERYDHFMLKEIHEQPQVLEKLEAYLGAIDMEIKKPKRILIIGCGSSYHAGLLGKIFIEKIAGIYVCVELASEFQHSNMPLKDFDLCILISQSGETYDILEAYDIIKSHNIRTLGVINVLHSTLARCVDITIPLCAGPEIGVASTKAFTAQVAILYTLAHIFKDERRIPNFSEAVKKVLIDTTDIEKFTMQLIHYKSIFFIGRHVYYPLAMEAALKLKEISYMNAQAYAGGELKHGPLALIDIESLVIAFAPLGELYARTISNVQETLARGATVLLLTDDVNATVDHINLHHLIIPSGLDEEMALFAMIPMTQLLAYYSALKLGCSIDKPRNLAKSVTVA